MEETDVEAVARSERGGGQHQMYFLERVYFHYFFEWSPGGRDSPPEFSFENGSEARVALQEDGYSRDQQRGITCEGLV
jgi:hypothetical protein